MNNRFWTYVIGGVILIILIGLFSNSAKAASKSYDFEMVPGCMWTKDRGTCVVTNRFMSPIICRVSVDARTSHGAKFGLDRHITIPARMFDDSIRVTAPSGQTLSHVSAFAECTAE